MKPTFPSSTRLALLAALLLTFVIAGQALATTWGTPVVVAAESNKFSIDSADLTTIGSNIAVAVYSRTNHAKLEGGAPVMRVFARRSGDSGQTWSTPILLSRVGYQTDDVHVTSYGSAVDVVWKEAPPSDPYNIQIRYARSIDGGFTFYTPIGVSTLGLTSMSPNVSHGPNNRVAVSWNDQDTTNNLFVAVSTDGGITFAPTQTVFTNKIGIIKVAVGNGGYLQAAYIYGSRITVKHSSDNGFTWSTPQVLTHGATLWSDFEVMANGDGAFVTWIKRSSSGWSVQYSKTIDTGYTWYNPVAVTPQSGKRIWALQASFDGATLRFALSRCVTKACPLRDLYYVEGVDGGAWPSAEQIPVGEGYPLAVGSASRAIVLYGLPAGVKTITAAP